MAVGYPQSYAEIKVEIKRRRASGQQIVQTIRFLKADGGIVEFKKFNPYHDRLGRFASANGAAAIFRSMADFMRPGGQFDLEAAKADYRKFLQSVPEKNRMYLEQAMETVGFREVNSPKVVFGYSEEHDEILYNPSDPSFADYDSRVVLTHELGHRIDYYFVHSSEQAGFRKAIAKAKGALNADPQKFLDFAKSDGQGFLSDILSGICEDDYRFDMYHEKSYWMMPGMKEKDTFANLFSLEAFQDEHKLNFLKVNFPDMMKTYENFMEE